MANVVSFNNVEIPSFLRATGITFPTLGNVTVKESEIPRRYGNVDSGVKFGGKTVKLSVKAVIDNGRNLHEMSDELKQWLKGDDWQPSRLTFGEQSDKYILARVSNGVDIEDLFLYGESEIEFYSADPLKYGVNIQSNSFLVNQGLIPYDGQEKAPSVIEVTLKDNYSELTLTHEPSFKELKIQGTLQIGQVVTVDSDRKIIQIDGTTDMTLLTFGSEWLYMEQGDNTFTITTDKITENEFTVNYRRVD